MSLPVPSDKVVVKLSAVACYAEALTEAVYTLDRDAMEWFIKAIRAELGDHEVMAYQLAMDRLGLLPVKR